MLATVWRLWPYIRRHRTPLSVGLFCALASTAVSLAGPWVLKHAVDDLTVGVTMAKLGLYAALTLGVAVVGGVLRFLTRRILIGLSRRIEYDLRNDFFRHLERLPLGYYQSHRTGDLMSRATNDLSAVRMMIGPAVMYAVTTGALFVVAIVLMFSLSVKLTLVSLLALPLVSVAVRYFGTAIHTRFERIQEQLADLSTIVQEALSGVRVVRAYRQEAAEIAQFEPANAEYVRRNRALIALQGLFYPSLTFFLGVAALLVLWLGSREVITNRMTLGEFVAFNSYLAMLSWPMIAFGWVTNLLQRGAASWKRLLEVFDTAPAIRDREVRARPPGFQLRGAIEYRHLTLRLGDRVVLDDVSFAVEPGQVLAVVGPTGSGKSVLVSLLARLHDPPAGTVLVDGHDVLDLPLAVLRSAIGFVPQEPFLFSSTVAENIAFGDPADITTDGPEGSAALEGVRWAAAISRIDRDVEQFPRGYDTLVGERGITLSGGQKQRTAIARALAVDARILVLDDALSAVDTYTEDEILARLRNVMRQRTSIVVSHRVSTVRDADLIIVLKDGHIIERGTHDTLVALGGFYSELYRRQLLEEELAAS
jgi:ATP-binding cassette, subfamily B, multidrug efflux pump